MSVFEIVIPGFKVFRVAPDSVAALAFLCERCDAFFQMLENRPGNYEAATGILNDLAPGKGLDSKHLFLVELDGRPVGVIDMTKDFPGKGQWYIALLLIDPDYRAQGLGRKIFKSAQGAIHDAGGIELQLCVQQQNPRAKRFWETQGFHSIGEAIQPLPLIENRVWKMKKLLGSV